MTSAKAVLLGLLLCQLLVQCLTSQQRLCPRNCRCWPSVSDRNELRVACRWSHISDGRFSGLRKSLVRSLSIKCTERNRTSHFSERLFVGFDRLLTLVLDNCDSKKEPLPSRLFSNLFELRSLTLRRLGRDLNLEPSLFSTLAKLQRLTIVDSGLANLPSRLLCDAVELKLLDLSQNRLGRLDELSACTNSPLVLLNLTGNALRRAKRRDFAKLTSLAVLSIARNRLEHIEDDALSALTELKELYLGGNLLTEVRQLPPALTMLDLAENRLTFVPKAAAGLKQLLFLNMSHNEIDQNSPFMLANGVLRILDLSFNSFSQLTAALFRNVPSLTELSIVGNRIELIESTAMSPLRKLTSLSLARNKLAGLNNSLLQDLESLRKLDVSKNSLFDLYPGVFDKLTELKQLSLADNRLTEVPPSATRLYRLQQLDVSGNHIKRIRKGLLEQLPKLEYVKMARNRLETVDRFTFEAAANLKILDLSSNAIRHLTPHCFDRCPKLRVIQLGDNLIADIPNNVFNGVKRLELLNLTRNQISKLDFIAFPTQLDTLLCAENEIDKIVQLPKEQPNVRRLDLSGNRLFELNFVPNRVEFTNFSGNFIETVADGAFKNSTALKVIDLTNNKLKNLSDQVFGRFSTPDLLLRGNPLECSCKLEWMAESNRAFQLAKPKITDFSEVMCKHVLFGHWMLLAKATSEDLLCEYRQYCTLTCPCCEYANCGCNNVCPSGCTCFRDFSFKHNLVKCSGKTNVSPKLVPVYATVAYLDGLNLTKLEAHDFLSNFRLTKLYLNSSNISVIEPKAFKGLTDLLLLNLSGNNLRKFAGNEIVNSSKLETLTLANNELTEFGDGALESLRNLRRLDLSENRFRRLPAEVEKAAPRLADGGLNLGANRFKCDCDRRFRIQHWLPLNLLKVSDAFDVACFDNLTEHDDNSTTDDRTILSRLRPNFGSDGVLINFWQFERNFTVGPHCRTESSEGSEAPPGQIQVSVNGDLDENGLGSTTRQVILVAVFLLLLVFLLAVVSAVLCVGKLWWHKGDGKGKYKTAPSLNGSWSTTQTPVVCEAPAPEIPLITFDAFVAYSLIDEQLIDAELSGPLEHHYHYLLSLLYRDTSASHYSDYHRIHEQLNRAIQRSRCLIVALTSNFVHSEWTMTQIRTAVQLFAENKPKRRIIFVLFPGLVLDSLDTALGKHVRQNHYIWRTEDGFWDRLRRLIPPPEVEEEDPYSSSHYSDIHIYDGKTVDWL